VLVGGRKDTHKSTQTLNASKRAVQKTSTSVIYSLSCS